MPLTIYDSLPSTQDLCIERARAGEPAGLAVLARVQTAARGSRGRGWTAPIGNLNLSVLLRPDTSTGSAGIWALLAGVALHDAIRGAAPQAKAVLKWPNDILLKRGDGRFGKLGGILIDSAADASGGLDWMVIGFGVNLHSAPIIEGRETGCLAESGAAPEAEHLARLLLDAIAAREAAHRQRGNDAVIAAWLSAAQPLGTWLRVTSGGCGIEGRFAGLGPGGELRLDVRGDIRLLTSGEVFPVDGWPAA